MKRILLPIDGSKRSLSAVQSIESIFPPDKVEVLLLIVREDIDSRSEVVLSDMEKQSMPILDQAAALIPRYTVQKIVAFGIPGNEILKYAREQNVDAMIITKRTSTTLSVLLGSVATHLVKYAHCPVIVLPEDHPEI